MIKKNIILSFSSSRTSGLVLDCGAVHTTAVPIHDGYILNKAVAQTPLGGEFVLSQCRQLLDELNIELVPYYQIKSKVNKIMNVLIYFINQKKLGKCKTERVSSIFTKRS